MNFFSGNSRAAILLTLTMFCYASNHVIGRAVHADLPPLGLSFYRWLCGALILFPFVAPHLRRLWPLYCEHWRLLALLGFLMIGSTTLILLGLNYTTATNTSLINATQPTVTAFLSWLFLQERLRSVQWCGIFVALAGVVLMVLRGEWVSLQGLDVNRGDFLVLLAMFGFAGYAINIRKIPQEFNVVEALFAIALLGLVLLLPFYILEAFVGRSMPLTGQSVVAVVSLALLVSVLGMLMWTRGNQMIGPNRAAVYLNLLPVFGALLAISFLAETLAFYHVLGGLLIGLGMILALRSGTS